MRASLRRAGLAVVVATAVGCSSGTRPAAVAGSRPDVRPDPYDVAAARLCHAFDVFVNDVRRQTPIQNDSTAFEKAENQLKKDGRGPSPRWGTLVIDLDHFLKDGANSDINAVQIDGLAAGSECAKIPYPAKVAGGYT